MTITQFDHGYWYATELKAFALGLGVPSASKLRKDELERAIRGYLRSGTLAQATRRSLATPNVKDVAIGLHLDLRIVGYTNDAETKEFIERESRALAPEFKRRSGARYRLNRWREEQIASGVPITYRDLVREYVRLNQPDERYARVPHGRYINFMADFLAMEPRATHAQAVEAWARLKTLDAPKTYRGWLDARHD